MVERESGREPDHQAGGRAATDETLPIQNAAGVVGADHGHSSPEDLVPFLALGGNVCVCPLTEANLADGVCDLPSMRSSGGTIALGTDSNARISMLEETRWLEYVSSGER